MRILIDTNILIARENHHIIEQELQTLLRVVQELKHETLVHPKSIEDVRRDPNEIRRNITLSKLNTYQILEHAPRPSTDPSYIEKIGNPKNINDEIDDSLLFAVHKNAVNFLITEDLGIQKKARKLNISDRVLKIVEALDLFKRDIPRAIKLPPSLQGTTMANLDIEDSIFESLREDYPDFNIWYTDKAREGRNCWIYRRNDGSLGAVLIYKMEDEANENARPPLEKKRRLKIATMKVTYVGYKIGELLLKLSFEYAIKNNISEIYLTHFTRKDDYLVDLIEQYGFNKVSTIHRDWTEQPEDVYIKKIFIEKKDIRDLTPLDISKNFYPNFYDGIKINKFIVPIQPEYFRLLFTDFPIRQTTISEFAGDFIIEGNTIKKAYLSHSASKKMNPGDILLFYRSGDFKGVLSLGVIENVEYDMQDPNEIFSIVGKRTVYSFAEIEKISQEKTTVIIFSHHFHFKTIVEYDKLLKEKILTGPSQSITEIDQEKYLKIKKLGGIDERFAFD
ncbi:MAG: hypothetical protein JW891_02455 [Candidatus Lokiarchaeota archaeon]|nr:hypothetical protein [Candidatus Lokiarchaeota archaeon]